MHTTKIKNKEVSSRTREKIVTETIKTKARDATLLRKIVMRMMMK